ncbi:MAG: hypothetical protein RMJ15_00675 [Nitrososphaerota archaeon]|nr:hypothetical protein [Nitrososphaerota archaeon]
MKPKAPLTAGLKGNEKAVSPAISTVILTGAIVVLLLVTMIFTNDFLEARMTENEFSAMKQFIQTVGLQIDDVAWIPGRTQTIRYASRYGRVEFVDKALTYTVKIRTEAGYWELLGTYTTGILMFNMPVNKYSLGNNYHERILPTSGNFVNIGVTAPASYIFIVEKMPMADGNYIRIVVVPCIRVLNATIGGEKQLKFYLPVLNSSGNHPLRSQSVTLAGETVSVKTRQGYAVNIDVTFRKASLGFDEDFFKFAKIQENFTPNTESKVRVEFYVGNVMVALGLHG